MYSIGNVIEAVGKYRDLISEAVVITPGNPYKVFEVTQQGFKILGDNNKTVWINYTNYLKYFKPDPIGHEVADTRVKGESINGLSEKIAHYRTLLGPIMDKLGVGESYNLQIVDTGFFAAKIASDRERSRLYPSQGFTIKCKAKANLIIIMKTRDAKFPEFGTVEKGPTKKGLKYIREMLNTLKAATTKVNNMRAEVTKLAQQADIEIDWEDYTIR